MMPKPNAGRGAASLPRIDFDSVAAKLGDLRDIVASDLGDPCRSGKFRCPFHGDGNERTPSLHVWADHFHCYGCGERGDSLDWIARRDGLTLVEAARKADPSIVTVDDLSGHREATVPPSPARAKVEATPRVRPPEAWRDPEWQARVDGLVHRAEDNLWSRQGLPALEWLRRRGLDDGTIARFRLGFLPADTKTEPVGCLPGDDCRPRGIYAPRGVTLPWIAPGAWYSVSDGEPDGPRWVGMNVRRLAADVGAPLPEGVEKCHAVRGSKRGYLYPWPTIEPTQGELPMLVVEGEFDALLGNQLAGHELHVSTAGSASVRNLPRESRSALASCTWLFLSLDHDQAGAAAVRAWRDRFPHKARRVILPRGKDLTDFAVGGGDVLAWLLEVRAEFGNPSSGPERA